jgi:hypothetical protein
MYGYSAFSLNSLVRAMRDSCSETRSAGYSSEKVRWSSPT